MVYFSVSTKSEIRSGAQLMKGDFRLDDMRSGALEPSSIIFFIGVLRINLRISFSKRR